MPSLKLSTATKRLLRHISLAGIGLSFLLLYLGPVTFENDAVTIVGLAIGGITAVIAWLSF